MTRKQNLLVEVYQMKNKIAALNGEPQADLEEVVRNPQFYLDADRETVESLQAKIKELNKSYDKVVKARQSVVAPIAKESAATRKARIKADFERKKQEWTKAEAQTKATIEERLQILLGEHWGIKTFEKGYLCIGVIDEENTIDEQRDFFRAQTVDIRYEHNFLSDGYRFTCNFGTTGGFDMTGGEAIGERAQFYAGVGRLLADKALVEWLRDTMHHHIEDSTRRQMELRALKEEYNKPTAR